MKRSEALRIIVPAASTAPGSKSERQSVIAKLKTLQKSKLENVS